MELGIKNKSVFVTAASKGIGKSVAEEFIKEGCKVAICSRNEENLIKAAAEIKDNFGVEPFWVVCDLSKSEDINKALNVVKEENGNIDILINNCGGPAPNKIENIVDEVWEEACREILMSSVRLSKAVLPEMKKNKWGRIVNITSISAKQPVENLGLSNSFRAAVTAFGKTLSNEVGKDGVTVNCVAPGYTLTHRLYELAVDKAKNSGDSHEHILGELSNEAAMKRLARPDEIADAILFLASERASYITGNTISVDGGMVKSIF